MWLLSTPSSKAGSLPTGQGGEALENKRRWIDDVHQITDGIV
jgi:hypothetical protein